MAGSDGYELGRLGPFWVAAFDEAWTSFRRGNYGIGAVLIDPAIDSGSDVAAQIVARGRNRVGEPQIDPNRTVGIGGTFLAHAEMNAFIALPRVFATGLHLYTTLETVPDVRSYIDADAGLHGALRSKRHGLRWDGGAVAAASLYSATNRASSWAP